MNSPTEITEAKNKVQMNSLSGLIARARSPFWLAPMAGITDTAFRELMDEMGAGVLISELVSAKGLLYNSEKTKKMARIHTCPGTITGIQLFGESAEDIIRAAGIVQQEGADFIDLNLGCPVKKVVKKGCGAALMRDPEYLEKFLSEIKRGIDLPLTVKMRTGWSEEELTIHECVLAATNAGCEWVAIHGRTRTQGYEGLADWDLIREVKAKAEIPIIGNGDIRDADKARQCLNDANVDAVMIGRGALRNPWIFLECVGESGRNPLTEIQLLNRYLTKLQKYYDTRITLLLIRKFSTWLAFGYPDSAAFRRSMFQLSTVKEVLDCAQEFFLKARHLPQPKFDQEEAFMMGGHG